MKQSTMNVMIQLVVNSNLLREIDERKLINVYARLIYENKDDITDDSIIKDNLIRLLDWDVNGDNGLGVYCSKFESIKNKDWERLTNIIKTNGDEIEVISRKSLKEKRLEDKKIVDSYFESLEKRRIEHFTNPNYKETNRGKKGRPCEYNGRVYTNRQECIYKEGITKNQLYQYLKRTGQV